MLFKSKEVARLQKELDDTRHLLDLARLESDRLRSANKNLVDELKEVKGKLDAVRRNPTRKGK